METMIRATREIWNDAIALYLGERRSGQLWVAQNVSLVESADGSCAGPFLRLDVTAAQRLMDELWGCGLRPSEGSGSAGSLAATERHLKDMQTIALGLLRKDGLGTL